MGSGAVYRWHAEEAIMPIGWTNISGSIQLFDLTDGAGVVLMGVTALVSQFAVVATVFALTHM